MNEPDAEDELFAGGWAALARYPAMLGGTLAGQMIGIVIDSLIGSRGLWIPIACSVILEAVTGVRFGSPRGERLTDPAACPRVSYTYSVAFAAVSVPLAVWVGASHTDAVAGGVGLSFVTPTRVALALVVLVVATVARAGIMMAIVRSTGHRAPRLP
jgi:hypothetical protein